MLHPDHRIAHFVLRQSALGAGLGTLLADASTGARHGRTAHPSPEERHLAC